MPASLKGWEGLGGWGKKEGCKRQKESKNEGKKGEKTKRTDEKNERREDSPKEGRNQGE